MNKCLTIKTCSLKKLGKTSFEFFSRVDLFVILSFDIVVLENYLFQINFNQKKWSMIYVNRNGGMY